VPHLFALPVRSLRVRLLTGTLAWIVASIILAGFGLSALFRHHVALQFHAELKTHLDQLAANLAYDATGQVVLAGVLSDPRLAKPYSGLYWQIDRVAGNETANAIGLLRSRSLWDSVIEVPIDTPADGDIHQHQAVGPEQQVLGTVQRIVSLERPDNQTAPPLTLRLLVAADERLMIEPMARFNSALWLTLAILGLGLVIAAVVQVVVGLAPLRRLRDGLAAVHAGETPQLGGDFPAEIQPLVEEFNSVLAQNAEVVTRARTQAGNLAHALKTPLSVLANAANERDDELARLVSDQVDSARRHVDYHLSRARAAAKVRVPGAHTAVLPVVEGLLRVMRRVHADRQLELVVMPMADGLAFRGEEQDMQEMLGNVLDNACKWAHRRIEFLAEARDGKLLITVDDDGKGIAADRRNAVIGRGTRADEQVPGSGLGLAIVSDLAAMYGGCLELTDSRLGGLRVVLSLFATS
jgi:signal transduction histidine kinase